MNKTFGLLFLLTITFLTAGFTVGLTYAPCFASLCSEEFFPYSTRIHIAAFYGIIASTGCFLLLRTYSPFWHTISSYHLTKQELPILQKRVSVGGLALAFWVVGLTVASTGFWVDAELDFWNLRTGPLDWPNAQIRLAVTGIIGHHADILFGLVLIPVSRNSILGRTFELHQGTLLYAHKLLAYAFLIVVVAHGGAYYTFVATYAAASDTSPRKDAFNIDNPTLTTAQTERRGSYYSATLATGMLSFLLILVMTITALPVVRRKSYNTFYYCHIIFSVLLFICASIHASTDFYFLLPGLLLWVLDWGWRLIRGDSGSWKKVEGTLEDAEHGWFRITLPVSAKQVEDGAAEKHLQNHPLQSYYLNIPSVSKLQNHAFTAAKIGSRSSGPVFLFQRAQGREKTKQQKLEKEWTWKAGHLATDDNSQRIPMAVEVRVEGPYTPPSTLDQMSTADSIICFVGGTGLTGAYSIALWWIENRSSDANATFTLVWTVRQRETAFVREWQELEAQCADNERMRLEVHISSENGRIDFGRVLREEMDGSSSRTAEGETGKEQTLQRDRKAWVYISGPAGLLIAAEDACVDFERQLKQNCRQKRGLDSRQCSAIHEMEHYVAKWEV